MSTAGSRAAGVAASVTEDLGAVAELPLALASWAFVKGARRLLKGRAVGQSQARGGGGVRAWAGWSELNGHGDDVLQSMIVCPRWNPHAIQHLVGPLEVKRELAVDVANANRSARIWIISVFRDGREVHTLCTDPAGPTDWHRLSLPAGSYSVFVRYYQPQATAECPAIEVDGACQVAARPLGVEADGYAAFLERLRNRKGLIYRFLHSHAYVAVRLRRWASEAFVHSVYLPYGNPQTSFLFGSIGSNECLRLEVAPEVFEASSVHLVFFNRCGFPVSWHDIPRSRYSSLPTSEPGSYLVRVICPSRKLSASDLLVVVESPRAAGFVKGASDAG